MKKHFAILAALILTLMPACSSDDTSSSSASKHNSTDVMFAQMMIPHHEQAIEMADMLEGKQVSTELTALAKQVKAAQQPEIDQMKSWLDDWDEPMPHGPMDHGSHGGMSGMMSQEDMDALAAADGAEFEKMWLEMMIDHHQGAIQMAEMEQSNGKFPDAVGMARDIITSQQAEIKQMQDMLGQ